MQIVMSHALEHVSRLISFPTSEVCLSKFARDSEAPDWAALHELDREGQQEWNQCTEAEQ